MGNTFPADAESAVGKTFTIHKRQYRIVRQLGEGGFAYVFEVVEDVNKKHYAMKRILAQDRTNVELAEKEINILKQCRSSNVVMYKGHSKIVRPKGDGRRTISEYLILMEYCDGGTLNRYIDNLNTELPEREVLAIFADICKAVKTLHSCDPPICHRDLKLENILQSRERVWKLCDFGSCTTRCRAYTNKEEISREEERIQMYTTSSYRSPEMVDLWRRKVVGPKADIWALACILYSIAFRKHPFQDGSALQIANQKVKMPKRTGYSKDFMKLLKVLFSIDPDKRPTIFQVEKHVIDLMAGRPLGSLKHGSEEKRRKKVAVAESGSESEEDSVEERRRKRKERKEERAREKEEAQRRREKERKKKEREIRAAETALKNSPSGKARKHRSPKRTDSDNEESASTSSDSTEVSTRRRKEKSRGRSKHKDRGNTRLSSKEERKRKQRSSKRSPAPSPSPAPAPIDLIDFSAMDSAPAFPASAASAAATMGSNGNDEWVAFAAASPRHSQSQQQRIPAHEAASYQSAPSPLAPSSDLVDLFSGMGMSSFNPMQVPDPAPPSPMRIPSTSPSPAHFNPMQAPPPQFNDPSMSRPSSISMSMSAPAPPSAASFMNPMQPFNPMSAPTQAQAQAAPFANPMQVQFQSQTLSMSRPSSVNMFASPSTPKYTPDAFDPMMSFNNNANGASSANNNNTKNANNASASNDWVAF